MDSQQQQYQQSPYQQQQPQYHQEQQQYQQQQPYQSTPAPAAGGAAAQGPINNDDIADWTARLNDVLARPGEHVNSKSPAGAQSWYNAIWGCFNPIDTCLMSWCCSCVVFGRTHHRLRKNANLEGYEPINTTVCFPLPLRYVHR